MSNVKHIKIKSDMEEKVDLRTRDREKLRAMKYSDFLKTNFWQKVAKRVRKRAKFKCQVCGCSDKTLHVHHNSYEHHGEENKHLEDLVCLCEDCHRLYHGKNQADEDVKEDIDIEMEVARQAYEGERNWNSYLQEQIDKLNFNNSYLLNRNKELTLQIESFKKERDYAEWKLRNFYESRCKSDENERKRRIDDMVAESLNRDMDYLPF